MVNALEISISKLYSFPNFLILVLAKDYLKHFQLCLVLNFIIHVVDILSHESLQRGIVSYTDILQNYYASLWLVEQVPFFILVILSGHKTSPCSDCK